MIVGVPKEVKNNEFRVSTTPSGVHALVSAGHEVLVEVGAGLGSAILDSEYVAAGAKTVTSADEVWQKSDLIIKVKEPIAAEYHRMRACQILFTYLHLAASRECTDALLKSGMTAIAYETVEENRQLPLLAPMSDVVGRMSIQVGADALLKTNGAEEYCLVVCPGCDLAMFLFLEEVWSASVRLLSHLECVQSHNSGSQPQSLGRNRSTLFGPS